MVPVMGGTVIAAQSSAERHLGPRRKMAWGHSVKRSVHCVHTTHTEHILEINFGSNMCVDRIISNFIFYDLLVFQHFCNEHILL